MNLKIIHSSFEIDLVDTSFIMIEENNWFNEKVYTKYTYPISITLPDDLISKLKFLTENNATGLTTIFNVYFYAMEVEHEAVFEIETGIGRKIEGQVRYGFEEFPNFSKKLAQLPLWKFPLVGETMYQHAQDRVAMTYPATDYVFSQVITSKLDTSTDQWAYFEGIVNNYNNNSFLINEYDAVNDIQINRNVIQPLPCLLYLLKIGFLDAGFTLAGDILTDPEFTKASLYSLSSFYSSITDAGRQEMIVTSDEMVAAMPIFEASYYSKFLVLADPGRYLISGNLNMQVYYKYNSQYQVYDTDFIFKGERIAHYYTGDNGGFEYVDLIVDVFPGENNSILEWKAGTNHSHHSGATTEPFNVLDITITQLAAYDPNGVAIPTLISPNEIDLTKCVPDKTFGDLFNMVKAWKNYDIDISGNVVTMNLVSNQIGLGPKKNLQPFEIKYPERIFNQGKTFELKFQDIQTDEYMFPSIFIDTNGVHQSPYIKKDETQEILIDAIALPLKQLGSSLTADGFIDDNGKFQVILYNGLVGGLNVCSDPSPLALVNIYPIYYADWIAFLLNAVGFKWSFNSYYEEIKDLTIKSTVFAYGQWHVVRKLSRKNVSNNIIQTEIETESID